MNGTHGSGPNIKLLFSLCSLFSVCSVVSCLFLLANQLAWAQAPYSLRFLTDPTQPHKVLVEVSGLSQAQQRQLKRQSPRWPQLLAVYAGEVTGLPPLAGTYEIQGDRLRFIPQFPFEPGLAYHAVFQPAFLQGNPSAPLTASFRLPPRTLTPTTVVTQVYPTTDVVPENLLKFYLHFSAPMSRGRSYEHIQLRDSSGKLIELPFLEIDEELWNPELTRLTVLIDPGRIKRGVTPLEEVGPALEAGQGYTLEISRDWRDGQGNPLKEPFVKRFRVGPSDRTPLNPAGWEMQIPPPDTHEPLSLLIPEPLDHALASRVINIVNAAGETLGGTITLTNQERRWQFEPDHVWRRGAYQVVIQTTLEDLAGNNIGKPFEVDLFEGVQRHLSTATVTLPFTIH